MLVLVQPKNALVSDSWSSPATSPHPLFSLLLFSLLIHQLTLSSASIQLFSFTFSHLSLPPSSLLPPGDLTSLFLSPSSSPSSLTLFSQVASPVTALIHFMTSINAAQVVVAGNKNGVVSWYISQPPQKTFSLLFSAQNHAPHPVIALQVRETRVLDTRDGQSLVCV